MGMPYIPHAEMEVWESTVLQNHFNYSIVSDLFALFYYLIWKLI